MPGACCMPPPWRAPSSCCPGPRSTGRAPSRLLTVGGAPWGSAALLQHMEKHQLAPTTLKRVVIGGAAAPLAMIRAFRERYGIEVIHAWGMTELSPLGTVNHLLP